MLHRLPRSAHNVAHVVRVHLWPPKLEPQHYDQWIQLLLVAEDTTDVESVMHQYSLGFVGTYTHCTPHSVRALPCFHDDEDAMPVQK